jgi:hypothetical protein
MLIGSKRRKQARRSMVLPQAAYPVQFCVIEVAFPRDGVRLRRVRAVPKRREMPAAGLRTLLPRWKQLEMEH